MNIIQRKKSAGEQCNCLVDAVLTMMKNKICTIDNYIYIKLLSDGTVSYITVSTDYVLNTTNNETTFTELRRSFEKYIQIKVQEGSIL